MNKRISISTILALIILCSSCSGPLKLSPRYKGVRQTITTLGICTRIKQSHGGYEFEMTLIDAFTEKCDTARGYPLPRIMAISPDTLSRIEAVGQDFNAFKTYVPLHPGISGMGYKPEVILLITDFSTSQKDVQTIGGSFAGFGTVQMHTMGQALKKETYHVAFAFWDNVEGHIIGYGELEKEISLDDDGPRASDRKEICEDFADDMISALKRIMMVAGCNDSVNGYLSLH